jgi:hypothetical protein
MTGARIACLGALLALALVAFFAAYDLVFMGEWGAAGVSFVAGWVACFFMGDSLINVAFDEVQS